MELNFLRRKYPDKLVQDAEALKQIPINKLPEILEFTFKVVITEIPVSVEDLKELSKKTKTTYDLLMHAIRIISSIIVEGVKVTQEELREDLHKLDIPDEVIDQILEFVEANKNNIFTFAEKEREEAIPVLRDLNWRIDIRYSSGDFLWEPTVYALLRIVATDGQKSSRIYLELDKDDVSWIERTFSRIKAKFIEAEEIKTKMFPHSSKKV